MPEISPIVEEGLMFWFTQEWTDWFRSGLNWRNFHLIEISYEDEVYMGQRELVVFLLGLGVTFKWCYETKSKGLQMVKDRVADIRMHPEAAVRLEDVLRDMGIEPTGKKE